MKYKILNTLILTERFDHCGVSIAKIETIKKEYIAGVWWRIRIDQEKPFMSQSRFDVNQFLINHFFVFDWGYNE